MRKLTTNLVMPLPHLEVEIVSIKGGVIKFTTSTPGLLFDGKTWDNDKQAYDYSKHDAINKILPATYTVGGQYGTFLKLPGRFKKKKGSKTEFALNAKGKKIWVPNYRLVDPAFPEFDRTDHLSAMLTAAIDAKEGRFEYFKRKDTDLWYAIEQVEEGVWVRCPQDKVEEKRAAGKKVIINSQSFSCTRCMNCVSLMQSDDPEEITSQEELDMRLMLAKAAHKAGKPYKHYLEINGGTINDPMTLGSRSTFALTMEGEAYSRYRCYVYDQEELDADAAAEFNDEYRIDREYYTDAMGNNRKIGAKKIPIKLLRHVEEANVIQDKLEREFEAGTKELFFEEYDAVGEVEVNYNEFAEYALEERGSECPFFRVKDPAHKYYEGARANKAAIMYPTKDKLGIKIEAATTNKKVKAVGVDRKIIVRIGKFEASYMKKSVLELQLDFLGEVKSWVAGGTGDDDRAKSWFVTFRDEKPVDQIKDQWNDLHALFIELI